MRKFGPGLSILLLVTGSGSTTAYDETSNCRNGVLGCQPSPVENHWAEDAVDQFELFQRKAEVAVGFSSAANQSANLSAGSTQTASLAAKFIAGVSLVRLMEHHRNYAAGNPDPILNALSNGFGEVMSHPDVTLALILILFIVVPCCFCFCYMGGFGCCCRSFWNPFRLLRYNLHDPEHERVGGMQSGYWMVVLEEGFSHVKFFQFDTQSEAQKFFNSTASFIARVLFQPTPDGRHTEVRSAGMMRMARDNIRTWSLQQEAYLVKGKYMVAVLSNKGGSVMLFPFIKWARARSFMQTFEHMAAILYDEQGHEVDNNGANVLSLHKIRRFIHPDEERSWSCCRAPRHSYSSGSSSRQPYVSASGLSTDEHVRDTQHHQPQSRTSNASASQLFKGSPSSSQGELSYALQSLKM